MADNNFAVRIILILVAVVILVILITQYNKKRTLVVQEESKAAASKNFFPRFEAFQDAQVAPQKQQLSAAAAAPARDAAADGVVRPSEQDGNEDYKAVDFDIESKVPNDCFPRDKITVDDLLPKDAANSKWAQVNPAGQGDVKDQNFLTAGMHIGVDTVGQTLRNANYQLRSDPPNPKAQVSPWNQTTIEYDSSRRFFEVGEC